MSKHLPMVFDDELFGPVIADSRAKETLHVRHVPSTARIDLTVVIGV